MAAERKCCVNSCGKQREENVTLHKFPNPRKDPDRFRTWTFAIGGNILVLDHTYVYNYRRVCHMHFEKKYWLGSKMLSNIAVPTLQLKVNETVPSASRANIHAYRPVKRKLRAAFSKG